MTSGMFDNLRVRLEGQEWPNVYLFKFIVPNTPRHIAMVTSMFGSESVILSQPSRNGKFVSISIKEMMLDVESIIEIYQKSTKIENVIAL